MLRGSKLVQAIGKENIAALQENFHEVYASINSIQFCTATNLSHFLDSTKRITLASQICFFKNIIFLFCIHNRSYRGHKP